MNLVKGDTVVIRRGKEKGKRGTIKEIFHKSGQATVEGLNIVKRHSKAGQTKGGGMQGGTRAAGIYEKEAPIPMSALQYVCVKCGRPTRLAHKEGPLGKQRACRHCGEPAPASVKGT